MYTNVNLPAPVGVLLFLGTGFLLLVVGLALVYSLIRKKFGLTRFALIGMAAIAGLYFGIMLIFSFASSDKVLARGQEKHFCEIDCHLAYSVADVHDAKTLGNAPQQVTASGTFRVVTIKTRFDEATISSTRGDSQLYPNSRVLAVVDKTGQKYFPSDPGQIALESSQGGGTPLTTPLQPGGSYATTFVFDLPADIQNPTLLIREGEVETGFIIGHENSPFHKTTRFQI